MAVTHRLHMYHGSHREFETPGNVTAAMQGKNNHGPSLRSGEHIVSSHYIDGKWFVFTEEIIMGPSP